MAKVTITISDEPNGQIDLKAEFDPPIQPEQREDLDSLTDAQMYGAAMIQWGVQNAEVVHSMHLNENDA